MARVELYIEDGRPRACPTRLLSRIELHCWASQQWHPALLMCPGRSVLPISNYVRGRQAKGLPYAAVAFGEFSGASGHRSCQVSPDGGQKMRRGLRNSREKSRAPQPCETFIAEAMRCSILIESLPDVAMPRRLAPESRSNRTGPSSAGPSYTSASGHSSGSYQRRRWEPVRQPDVARAAAADR